MKYLSLSAMLIIGISLTLFNCSGRNVIKDEKAFVEESIVGNPLLSHHLLSVESAEHTDTLHYVSRGNPDKPTLLIIHGTPGGWSQYARYLLNEEMLKHFFMIVIDRPGWGESVLGGDQSIASFEEQARIISALLALRKQESQQPVLLMGHSLGASLAPRIAMDYPELVDGLLLFAGTLNPSLSSPRWFNYVARVPGVKYIIGERFHLSNKEIFALKADIGSMAGRWDNIRAKILVVQGSKDGLVYPENADYAETAFPPRNTRVVRLEQEGHLFPMTMRNEVVAWAKQVLNDI